MNEHAPTPVQDPIEAHDFAAIEQREYANGVNHLYGVDAAGKRVHIGWGAVAAHYGVELGQPTAEAQTTPEKAPAEIEISEIVPPIVHNLEPATGRMYVTRAAGPAKHYPAEEKGPGKHRNWSARPDSARAGDTAPRHRAFTIEDDMDTPIYLAALASHNATIKAQKEAAKLHKESKSEASIEDSKRIDLYTLIEERKAIALKAYPDLADIISGKTTSNVYTAEEAASLLKQTVLHQLIHEGVDLGPMGLDADLTKVLANMAQHESPKSVKNTVTESRKQDKAGTVKPTADKPQDEPSKVDDATNGNGAKKPRRKSPFRKMKEAAYLFVSGAGRDKSKQKQATEAERRAMEKRNARIAAVGVAVGMLAILAGAKYGHDSHSQILDVLPKGHNHGGGNNHAQHIADYHVKHGETISPKHQEAIRMHKGDTIWGRWKAKHPNANMAEILRGTKRTLRLNHLTWEQARHLRVGRFIKLSK